jgi:thiamine kinase-like enzyme
MRTGALPVLIDWEYAAMGDLFFDLACLLEEHKHLALSEVELLQKYGVDPQCAPKLRVYRAVYSALAAAWARCRGLSNASQLAYIEALLND